MRTWIPRGFALLLLVLPFGPVVAVEADDAEVERLVKQLGSSDFRIRDAATKRLQEISMRLIDALRRAETSNDLEVRGRAKQIVAVIGKKLHGESTESLKPQTVWQGTYEDPGVRPAPMILFVKSRDGDRFQGAVWYPDPINNHGLASVSGRIDANGTITFSERRIQGEIEDGITYTATLNEKTIVGSYRDGSGKILLRLSDR